MKGKLKVFLATFFLTISIGAVAQVSIHDMTDTWTDGGTTYDAIKMDVTDTASAADSKLINLEIGGVTQFGVLKDGHLTGTVISSQNDEYIWADGSAGGTIGTNLVILGSNVLNATTTTPNSLVGIGTDIGPAMTGGSGFGVYIGHNILAGGSLDRSVMIGSNQGTAQTYTRSGVVTIGDGAGYTGIGSNSIYIGRSSGYSAGQNTEHATCIGATSCYNLAGSDEIVAVGGSAGWESGDDGVHIGYGAGRYSTGPFNTHVGWSAGNIGTTSRNNTFIGNDADGIANDDSYAVAVGMDTLVDSYAIAIGYAAKAEADSIAIGANALDSTTTGAERNIAIGRNAGTAITTADDNIAIGYEALDASTGIGHIAIGTYSGGAAVTGSYNIALGVDALRDLTGNQSHNIAIGESAAYRMTGGQGNIVLGRDALGNTGSGRDYNLALGYSALDNVTTGDYNIGIGYSVGSTTTGSRNLLVSIGVTTNTPSSSTSANGEMNIVNSFVGKMPAYFDDDVSLGLDVRGPAAYPTASTNIDGGALYLEGGAGSSSSAGDADGGNVEIRGGTGYGTGDDGFALINDTVYGIMSVQAGATSQDDIGTTPEILVAWNTNGIANGTTPDQANDYISVDHAGVYEVIANVSFSGTANSTVDMEIYVYDDSGTAWGASGFELQRKLGTGGDVGNAGTSGLVTLDVDDRVALYVATDGATDDVTVTEAQLQIKRISD